MRRTRTAALLLLPWLATLTGSATASHSTAGLKTNTFYVIMAHPDDEVNSWAVIEKRPPTDYVVFVTLTHGEGTISCLRAEDSQNLDPPYEPHEFLAEGNVNAGYKTGPYKYQGPNSPVGQPNHGERHPLGFPWVGVRTEACADAGIASWHWFLDDAHYIDGSGTDMGIVEDPRADDDYRGKFCPPGHQGDGGGRPAVKRIGCADVWANAEGARIAFSVPDMGLPRADDAEGLDAEEVTAAIQTVRQRRFEWGIPVLPEAGMVSASGYYVGTDPDCLPYPHLDHKAVQDALWQVNHGAGPQLGPVMHNGTAASARDCDDPYRQGSRLVDSPRNWATVLAHNDMDPVTRQRIGPYLVNYGWRFATFYFGGSSELFWERFG